MALSTTYSGEKRFVTTLIAGVAVLALWAAVMITTLPNDLATGYLVVLYTLGGQISVLLIARQAGRGHHLPAELTGERS